LNASLLILQLQEQGLFTAAEAAQAAHQRLVQVLEQSAIGQEFLRASLAASTPGLSGYTGPLPLAGNLRVLELRSATHPGEEEAVRRTLSNEGFLHADDVQAKAFALSTLCLSRGPNITPADADVAGEGVTTHPTGGSGLAPPLPTTLMTPPQPTRRVSTREALVSRPPPTEERQPLATSGRRSRSRERPQRSRPSPRSRSRERPRREDPGQERSLKRRSRERSPRAQGQRRVSRERAPVVRPPREEHHHHDWRPS
ncbi:hypothetical protein Vretimale_9112, partial [Volvox reticuliferus]